MECSFSISLFYISSICYWYLFDSELSYGASKNLLENLHKYKLSNILSLSNVVIYRYKDNELVNKSANYILLTNGDLFILKVTNHKKEKDTGVYYCLARNQHGKARSHNATIEIACKYYIYIYINTNIYCYLEFVCCFIL